MTESKPTVLVTGGAGFLGINLMRYLDARGYALVSLDIADFDYPDMRDKIKIVKGDIRDRGDRGAGDGGGGLCRPYCGGAAALCQGRHLHHRCRRHAHCVAASRCATRSSGRCMISSTAVYGIPDHHPLCRERPAGGCRPYGQAKIQAEEVCLEYRARGWSCRSSGPSRLSARSGWASSRCSTTGR